jgi:ribosomal protein S19E (S16A)
LVSEPTLEDIMRRVYRNVVRDLLVSEILGHKKLAPDFFSSSSSKQEAIEDEIERKSVEIADDIVAELKKQGYVDKEPSEALLSELVKEVMKRHGAGEK